MGTLSAEKIQIGVSSCLLGEKVRYDGGHKRSRFITEVLADYFHFVPLCPEMAIGLGVPRPPIQLVGKPDSPRAIRPDDPPIDATEALDDYGRKIGQIGQAYIADVMKTLSKPAKRQAQFNVLQYLAPRQGALDSRR